ncbi:MAG: hypothetical protein WCI73_06050, partial [Phycisphaerae bacterium]
MDNKRLIPIMLVVSVLMLGYFWISEKNKPAAPPATAPVSAPASNESGGGAQPSNNPDVPPLETVTLGSLDPQKTTKMQIVVSNQTAGIELVQLNPRYYRETTKGQEPY